MALWKKVEEELIAAFFGTNEYPVEVEYTLEQDILISHSGTSSEYTFKYRFSIPPDRTSNHGTQYHFVYDDESGKTNLEPTSLQRVVGMNVIFGNGDTYSIPLNGDSVDKSNAIPLSQNYGELYYPTAGGSDYQCIYGQCVIWESSLNPGSSKGVTIEYEIEGAAFAWQKSSKIPSKIPGKSNGISASNSGTFSDIWTEASPEEQNQIRGAGTLYLSYGRNSQWYKADDQSGNERWVIDAENSIVIDAAQDILGDLSSDDKQNVYAFTKATFDYLRDRVTYDPYAPVKARSGPECLSLGKGDCDEQSNAFMSILRYKQVPAWYEFGALTSLNYEVWERHAWANVMIPYSDEYCIDNQITWESCYVAASVDVVNNKWLLHTPTAFTNWIEIPDPTSQYVSEYYTSIKGTFTKEHLVREETWTTIAGPDISGGTFTVG